MPFSLSELIAERQAEQYTLHKRYANGGLARVLHIIGFDRQFVWGEGAYLWDAQGKRYLDLIAGYSVYNLGRDHPVVRQAVEEAISLRRPNMVKMDAPLLSGLLAEGLAKHMPPGLEATFFSNSGSEAVETAIKFARAATGRRRMLYLDHAFHGLTMGALSLNGGHHFREGFEPLLSGFTPVPMNDIAALENELRKGNVAAFIVEPIQGKGVYIPTDTYLPEAQSLCHQYGALFICDEVQSGMGRTGRFLACQHWGLEPDIVTVAKSLGGGFMPVGATVARRWIFDKTFDGLGRCQVHTSTFGDNELAMAAGLAALYVLDEDQLIERAARLGDDLISGLRSVAEKHDMVLEVRGRGLMIGIEFGPPRSWLLRRAWHGLEHAQRGLFAQLVVMALLRDHRILTQVGGPDLNIIKLLPPLTIGDDEVRAILAAFDDVLGQSERLWGRVWRSSAQLARHAIAR